MSVISETYNHTHIVLELEDVLSKDFFTESEALRNYY